MENYFITKIWKKDSYNCCNKSDRFDCRNFIQLKKKLWKLPEKSISNAVVRTIFVLLRQQPIIPNIEQIMNTTKPKRCNIAAPHMA